MSRAVVLGVEKQLRTGFRNTRSSHFCLSVLKVASAPALAQPLVDYLSSRPTPSLARARQLIANFCHDPQISIPSYRCSSPSNHSMRKNLKAKRPFLKAELFRVARPNRVGRRSNHRPEFQLLFQIVVQKHALCRTVDVAVLPTAQRPQKGEQPE